MNNTQVTKTRFRMSHLQYFSIPLEFIWVLAIGNYYNGTITDWKDKLLILFKAFIWTQSQLLETVWFSDIKDKQPNSSFKTEALSFWAYANTC